jgi:hypothetical protein
MLGSFEEYAEAAKKEINEGLEQLKAIQNAQKTEIKSESASEPEKKAKQAEDTKLKPEEKIRKMAVASCHYYGAIDCFDFEEADAEVLEYNKKVTPKRERIIRKIEFDAAKTLDKIIISPDEALEVVEAFENNTYV